jgi:hypothetical protein
MRRLVLIAGSFCLFVGGVASAPAVQRSIFVTSVAGTGNLSSASWQPYAGTATGIDAGDAICQALAQDAGLAHPLAYRAWLSSFGTDAYCHVQDLTGFAANDCDGALAGPAGPWTRVDGKPWAAELDQALYPNFEIYLPPWIDENGNVVHDLVWTGTSETGTHLVNEDCGYWEHGSSGYGGEIGTTDGTGAGWTDTASSACDVHRRLYCLQKGAGDPLPPFENWGRLAFLTSARGSGRLAGWPAATGSGTTGILAGDAICRKLASDAGLPEADSFKAWLSDGATDARDRFVYDGPWMRLDRVRLASDLADLTDAYLHSPLNLTETGVYVGNDWVWTDTESTGVDDLGYHCYDWTSDASTPGGAGGSPSVANTSWTQSFVGKLCDDAARLYCLQDLPLVFADAFESGTTGAWSSASP